jgi:regulatory protein
MGKQLLSAEVIRQRMADYCSKSEHCKSEVLKKMQAFTLSAEETESILHFLESEGYINEFRYAKAFANDKIRFDRWGKLKIRYALLQKKIEESAIDAALNDIDEETYLQILSDELKKKLKTLPRSLTEFEKKQKLFRFGYQRGFESHHLEQVIAKLI